MTKRYDKTQSTRQSRRRAALNALAQQLGYDTWSKLETAVLRGDVVLTGAPVPETLNQSSTNTA